jgi:sialic acid synthase SpsE
MRIGSFDTAERVLVVAEIGNNHEGDFDRAMRLVESAAAAGVNAVKFQTARAELFISAADVERQRRFASYEFSPAQWATLAARAHGLGLLFLSTPLDLRSLTMLAPLVDAIKVASGDITFLPLLDSAAQTRKPIIFSTGAATLEEVEATVRRIHEHWRRIGHSGQLGALHCVSAYPAPPAEHVLGIEAACAAVALGARIVEKHFTLDKQQSSFRDHQLSADPADMTLLVQRIRQIEPMLGVPGKTIQPSESVNRTAIRRSIAAARDLPAGHVLRAADLIWLRPGSGLAPGEESLLIGRTVTRGVSAGSLLSEGDVS